MNSERTKSTRLTHLDRAGRPGMVDVADKRITERRAVAVAEIALTETVVRQLRRGDELESKKGPVFQTAVLAGTMAAKRTGDLIPLCHPLPLEGCRIEIGLRGTTVHIRCETRIRHRTGVEMEALTGATVAALTIYDMCKAVSHDLEIRHVRLLEKSGGKSHFRRKTP